MIFSFAAVSLLHSVYSIFMSFFTTRLYHAFFSQGQEFGGVLKSGSGENATVEKQGCHPFYESLIDDPYIAEVSYGYRSLQFFVEIL